MVSGKYKSRRLRRVHVRTPGGRTVIHYRERKAGAAHCASCGKQLSGTLRVQNKTRKISKTSRRPSRPYGGVLCSNCTRELLKSRVRSK